MERLRKTLKRLKGLPPENQTYQIITDFENKNEKECVKIDHENSRIYSELLNKAKKARASIKNSGLQMSLEVPPPPIPNNRDRFSLWKKRNISEKVIPQSEAIYFLTKHEYELDKDYEAYQAISLADEIMKQRGIKKKIEDKSKDFTNVYTDDDQNILRRFSIYGMHEYNKARDTARINDQQEENYFFKNRTKSMPNINYRRNSISNAGDVRDVRDVRDARDARDTYDKEANNSPILRRVRKVSFSRSNTDINENMNMNNSCASGCASGCAMPSAPVQQNDSSPCCSNRKESTSLYPKLDC